MHELLAWYLWRPQEEQGVSGMLRTTVSQPVAASTNPTPLTMQLEGMELNVSSLFTVHNILGKVLGRLNHKWMHNEQLFVWPCGVIVSRCTFYHAESLTASKVSDLISIPRILDSPRWTLGLSQSHIPHFMIPQLSAQLHLLQQQLFIITPCCWKWT